ncbi:unnamed protein product [Mycena citricolor]|uniref:Heparinase II/III-like C-terminal domain-containing protein n=1 Tax=Mycena citricolor TaxID=2018698 RepID=A0AAD2HDB9_9AGAR|nr:unnamed protein product [Mycena citricolor]
MATQYQSIQGQQQPMYSDPAHNGSTGYISSPAKKGISNWVKIGIPVAVVVIVAAVVGGVVGSRHHSSSSSSSSSASGSGSQATGSAASAHASASSAVSAKLALGRFATATNSEFMMPIYPSTTDSSAFSSPTFVPSTSSTNSWPKDPFSPSSPDVTTVRPDRPRLIAPAYRWAALPELIANDPYLKGWNATIFGNATQWRAAPPVVYFMDGSSGILDNSRSVKERIKAFAYAYRMTNDTAWVDRTWEEIQNAAGNGTTPFGPDTDKWNAAHFLDTAEMSAAYAIAYDWLYDMWSQDQKNKMIFTLLKYGLQPGLSQFTTGSGWWANNITGNWNCVCNGGLTLASLAILGDDGSGVPEQLLAKTVPNAVGNCAKAVSPDGTWAETANYWYFGTTAHAEMASSLISATGSDYGLLDTNTDFSRTGDFHMYVTGATSLFNYGDHGPNKFSTTANSMFLYADHYNEPQYALFQRDMADAAEPWSMFWYNPSIKGAFWDGKPLDHFFSSGTDQWASMRSSWTDNNALYVGIKASTLRFHQTHNDLDVGDFVLDALGTRWFGELGSADYNAPEYFTSDAQDAVRWQYYRKMTEGQNTILIGQTNQNVDALPTVQFGTSNTTQGPTTVMQVPQDSTAFFVTDMTSAYFNATSVKRGIRLLNARTQVLLQDEVTASAGVMWRAHTNATVNVDSSGTSASLSLDGQTMKVQMLNAPNGAQFTTGPAVRFPSDVTPPIPDQPNPGVTVLMISLPAGTYSLQVLFSPQASGANLVTPPSVGLDQWTLTSHN